MGLKNILNIVSTGLDVVGMIPVVGNVASLLNVGVSLAKGDLLGAGLNLLGVIPGVGQVVKGVKLLKNVKNLLRPGLKLIKSLKLANLKKIVVGAKNVFSKLKTGINKLSNKIKSLFKRSNPPKPTQQSCGLKGEPVDAIHGLVFYDLIDFEYPGVIPFAWERSWNSGNARLGALGYGTGTLYTMHVEPYYYDDSVVFVNEKGREIYFDLPKEGETLLGREEKLSLTSSAGKYEIFNHENRLRYVFEGEPEASIYPLRRIENETREHKIVLEYDGESKLRGITDTAGRYFEIKTNEAGLIAAVRHDGRTLVEYAYDGLLNLTEITDVNGAKSTIFYKNHLMIKRITKNGDTFQWEYDGEDENAKCIHTWGDNGLLEGWFSYHDDHTVFRNSFGGKEVFYYNKDKLLTKHIDANEAETLYTYNDYGEIASVTGPDGETTAFEYNDFGQITSATLPNGAVQMLEYDNASRLVKSVAPNGAETVWQYDEMGRVSKVTLPTGVETVYQYNKAGMVSSIIEGEGENERLVEFQYDKLSNLCQLKYPNGAVEKWEYDKLGNCLTATNPLGAVQSMEYDNANRLVKHTAENGNVTHLTYNAYDDVLLLKDNEREIRYAYNPLGNLVYRKELDRVIAMAYDTEGRLAHVQNEVGEQYAFARDAMGNIISETGYDGVVKSYQYSPGGKLTGMKRGETCGWANMRYDESGQLAEIIYENGDTETFTHGKMGELLTAENKSAKLAFAYDMMGNVVKETQNGQTVESEYAADYAGRTRLKTSLGLNLDMHLNKFGQTEEIHAGFQGSAYQSSLTYNLLGQMLERSVNTAGGGIIKDIWSYDKQGMPIANSLIVNQRENRRRKYQWGTGDKLKSIIDSIGRMGLEYSYDRFGVPEAENIKGLELPPEKKTTVRHLDNAGNVYETLSKTDRQYGAGGQLVAANGREYRYNDCGDLVEKKEANGDLWRYFYHPSGLMDRVVRPDGKEVTFAYDPLGRRISKTFDGKITKFLWDGDKIAHEWTEDSVTAWLFDENSFTPTAKLVNGKTYSIIGNHLGTPNEMINQDGETVWKAEFDVYGRPIIIEGGDSEETNCPFRLPGQFEDAETGLYYNRFRYYDPEAGVYTQGDPIGLAGGNPTLYGYVHDPNRETDPFGLISKTEQKILFEAYKTLRGGTETIAKIMTSTGVQRISTEFHHVFITQAMQRKYNLPNWLVNNRLNVWKLNTIQHSLLDKFRFNFLRKGIKPQVGWFKKYNWFTKFNNNIIKCKP